MTPVTSTEPWVTIAFSFFRGLCCIRASDVRLSLSFPPPPLLGWGASDNPRWKCRTSEEAYEYLVPPLERWREAMGIQRPFILCGHSMGAMLASEYALRWPQHVRHLVLASPCGVPEAPGTTFSATAATAASSPHRQLIPPTRTSVRTPQIYHDTLRSGSIGFLAPPLETLPTDGDLTLHGAAVDFPCAGNRLTASVLHG